MKRSLIVVGGTYHNAKEARRVLRLFDHYECPNLKQKDKRCVEYHVLTGTRRRGTMTVTAFAKWAKGKSLITEVAK